MPDRHWMEKWRWNRDQTPAVLKRSSDGKEARDWTHATEIEAIEKNISSKELLTNPRYQMVPLKDLYPDDTLVDEPVRLGPRREAKEAQAFAQRIEEITADENDSIPWAHKTGRKGTRHRGLFVFGWCSAMVAAGLFLVGGASLVVGIVGLLAFTAGVCIAGYIVRD